MNQVLVACFFRSKAVRGKREAELYRRLLRSISRVWRQGDLTSRFYAGNGHAGDSSRPFASIEQEEWTEMVEILDVWEKLPVPT